MNYQFELFSKAIILDYYLNKLFHFSFNIDNQFIDLFYDVLNSEIKTNDNTIIIETNITNLLAIHIFLNLFEKNLLHSIPLNSNDLNKNDFLELLVISILYDKILNSPNKDIHLLNFSQKLRDLFINTKNISLYSLIKAFVNYNYNFDKLFNDIYKYNQKFLQSLNLHYEIFLERKKDLYDLYLQNIYKIQKSIDYFELHLYHIFNIFNIDFPTKFNYKNLFNRVNTDDLFNHIIEYDDIKCNFNCNDPKNVKIIISYGKKTNIMYKSILYSFKNKEFYKMLAFFKKESDPFFLYLLFDEKYIELYNMSMYVDSVFYGYIVNEKLEKTNLFFLKALLKNFLLSFIKSNFDQTIYFIDNIVSIYSEDIKPILVSLLSNLKYTNLFLDKNIYDIFRNPTLPRKVKSEGVYKDFYNKMTNSKILDIITKINDIFDHIIDFVNENKNLAIKIQYENRMFVYLNHQIFKAIDKNSLEKILIFLYLNYVIKSNK